MRIDTMEGTAFEKYLAQVLIENDYKNVTVTATTGDQGVDIKAEKENVSFAIQAKRYSNPVGNKAVQEVTSGKLFFDLDEAMVVTTNFFTTSAKELASKNKVKLIDRLGLQELILNAIIRNPNFGISSVSSNTNVIISINANIQS